MAGQAGFFKYTLSDHFTAWCIFIMEFPLDAKQIEERLLRSHTAAPSILVFKAVDSETREVVGHIQLLAIDRANRTATVGRVLIGPARLRGIGLGAQMVRAVLRIGFEELGLHRIDLRVFTFNAPAIACYQRVGFQTEGLLREAYRAGEEFWSVYVMSVLEQEWRTR